MISGSRHTIFKKTGSVFFPVIITILFLYFAFRKIDIGESLKMIADTSIFWLAIYLLVFYASNIARAIRWKLIINPIKSGASLLNLFGAVMIGYGVNCIVPRLGEVYRGLFLGKWEGLSRTSMVGTVIVERIIDVTFFALASLISVLLFPGDLFEKVAWLRTSLIIGFSFIIVFIVMLVIIVRFEKHFTPALIKLSGMISKKFSARLSDIISTLIDGLSTVRNFRNFILIIFYTAVILLLYALNTYVGFYMLDMDKLADVNFAMAWVVMTISSYGVMLPTPGGTGSYHIITIFVLSQLYNFNNEVSAAYALLTHFISYVVFIGTTIFVVYYINKLRRKKGESSENFFSVFKADSELK